MRGAPAPLQVPALRFTLARALDPAVLICGLAYLGFTLQPCPQRPFLSFAVPIGLEKEKQSKTTFQCFKPSFFERTCNEVDVARQEGLT